MRSMVVVSCISACLAGLLAAPIDAGEVLDRLVNQMILDTHTGRLNRQEYKTITPQNVLGQTFTTGANIVEVSRIAIGIACWRKDWTPEKSLTLTLWDSPAKQHELASEEIPHKWKDWEGGVLMFTLNAPVKPNTQYYFELTPKGGDAKLVGVYLSGNYKGGGAYEGGKRTDRNIWFEIHARPVLDRDKLYSEMLSKWDLDHPGLEKMKAAVEKKDWDGAVDAMIAYYEARPDLVNPKDKVSIDPSFDRSICDLVMEKKFKAVDGSIVDIGPNWNYFRTWPTEGGVGLTRHGIMGFFRSGYLRTGDEKFPKCFDDMMKNMIDQMPSPIRAGAIPPGAKDINPAPENGIQGGSMWAGLSIAARMNQMWHFYSGLASSKNFTRDVRAMMIFNMVNMADQLAIQKGGGNWETQMSSSMFSFADCHPELKNSREWLTKSLDDVLNNMWGVSRADGATQEPTSNYHTLMLNRFLNVARLCRERNIPIGQKYVDRLEKILEYTMYATRPDWCMPATGDTFSAMGTSWLLARGADYFGRDDFLFMGTEGAEGRPPTGTSAQFPISGWFVMRSDWTPDARYLYLHNGIDLSHGHNDALEVNISAYGSNLIADPGCFIYGTDKHFELSTTKRHPTITVAGANAIAQKGPSTWASTRSLDYYNGTNAGYKNLPGVTHTRKIAFLKPDYWVISDTVNGQGSYEITSNFPFDYKVTGILDEATGVCRVDGGSGKMIISPYEGATFKGERYDTDFPIMERLYPAQGVKYVAKAELPASFAAAFYPYKGSGTPAVKVEKIGDESFRVNCPSGTDFVCFGDTTSGDIEFSGEAAVVRPRGSGMRSAAWVNGKSLSFDGRQIASSENPIRSLDLTWDGDTLVISASGDEPTLTVAALGAKYYRVGYGPLAKVKGAAIRPF